MDLRQVKNLMKEFEDSKIHKLEINDEGFSIKLEKESNNITFSSNPSVPHIAPMQQQGNTNPVVGASEKEDIEANYNYLVKAPLVGTFYQAPSPDSEPFVSLNQKVNKGDTLFIVEAMKVMNEITAPVSGTIVKIHTAEASMVEFGQIIMEIEE